MDKPQDPDAAETAQTTNVPAVDLPQLVRLCLKRGDKPYELHGDVCGDETCDQCGQSIWATDFGENHREGYKSDRNQNAERHPDAVHLKTLCTGCKKSVDCYWPPMTTFGGEPCTAAPDARFQERRSRRLTTSLLFWLFRGEKKVTNKY